jgi:hypothetical protein
VPASRVTATVRLDVGRLSAELTATGGLRRFDVDGFSLLQYPASDLEPGVGGLWVRRLHPDGTAEAQPLTGPRSGSGVATDAHGAMIIGAAEGVEWAVRLAPSLTEAAWFWHIAVRNTGSEPVTLDAVWAADVALKPNADVRINEYYVAQYLDLTPVETPQGSTTSAVGWSTGLVGRNPSEVWFGLYDWMILTVWRAGVGPRSRRAWLPSAESQSVRVGRALGARSSALSVRSVIQRALEMGCNRGQPLAEIGGVSMGRTTLGVCGGCCRVSKIRLRWGGWGSNPRPRDYESLALTG